MFFPWGIAVASHSPRIAVLWQEADKGSIGATYFRKIVDIYERPLKGIHDGRLSDNSNSKILSAGQADRTEYFRSRRTEASSPIAIPPDALPVTACPTDIKSFRRAACRQLILLSQTIHP